MNVWCEGEDSLASLEDVRALVGHDGPLEPDPRYRGKYVVGLDVGIVSDRTAACVAHPEQRDGQRVVVVDRVAVWSGSRRHPVDLGAVEGWLASGMQGLRRPQSSADPYQAVALLQNLSRRGIRVTQYNFSQSADRQARAHHVPARVHDRQLDLPADEALVDELAAAKLIERSPGVYRFDHAAGAHDDRVVATALAVQAILERPPAGPTSSSASAAHSGDQLPTGPPSSAVGRVYHSLREHRQDSSESPADRRRVDPMRVNAEPVPRWPRRGARGRTHRPDRELIARVRLVARRWRRSWSGSADATARERPRTAADASTSPATEPEQSIAG